MVNSLARNDEIFILFHLRATKYAIMLYVNLSYAQCIKSVWIWCFSCRPDIPAFGPEKTPNPDTFHAAVVF